MLLTGSGDELSGPALFQAEAYHLPLISLSAFPAFVYEYLCRDQPPVPFQQLCTFAMGYFSVPCSWSVFFFFFGRRDQSVQGAMLVYPRGAWGSTGGRLVLTCWSAECLPSRFGASD
jgi:hypothetical protein